MKRCFLLLALAMALAGCYTSRMTREAKIDDSVAYAKSLETGVCHIHNVKMERRRGMMRPAPDARERKWHWHTLAYGGDGIVIPRSSPTGEIWVCDLCMREAPALGMPYSQPPLTNGVMRDLPQRAF